MSSRRRFHTFALAVGLSALAGCSLLTAGAARAAADRGSPGWARPLGAATRGPRHAAHPARDQRPGACIGENQVLFARYENTFSAIGREYDLGFEEMRRANPGVDQWLPGEGTPVYLPTLSILPDAPRKGIVVNVPAMRLYYYTSEKSAADPEARDHDRHDVSDRHRRRRLGHAVRRSQGHCRRRAIPRGTCRPRCARSTPSAARSCRAIVPPGPDNPLGAFALSLSLPGYLIHGTNKPDGVGMRVSHGCIRLYPEDIEALFERVPRNTPVRIVNQPVLAGWRDGQLYLEVHPPLVEEPHDLAAEADAALDRALQRAGAAAAGVELDRAVVQRIVAEQRGMPLPVLRSSRSLEQYLASARIVANTVPVTVAEQVPQAAGGGASAGR